VEGAKRTGQVAARPASDYLQSHSQTFGLGVEPYLVASIWQNSNPFHDFAGRRKGVQMTTNNQRVQLPESEFESSRREIDGNSVFFRRYGQGPAILMIHGFPRTSLMWRDLAPLLAKDHTVICADLRGYGQSGTPRSAADHFPYSKRAIAQELVGLMDCLGFDRFVVIGHDRGGRVAYRMALDHPDKVTQLAVLDVIPILEAWDRTDARFARTYWPWILLSQQAPLPESYLLGAPDAVFRNPFGTGSFGPDILERYEMTFRDPTRVHAVCEEYRAAATIDVEHDRADKDAKRKIGSPVLHLWAESGPLDMFYSRDGGPLEVWRQWAPLAQGHAMQGGHFFPEENPSETARVLLNFINGREP
jgi:haloacetate dehalogenase